jgi:hypothetical protein
MQLDAESMSKDAPDDDRTATVQDLRDRLASAAALEKEAKGLAERVAELEVDRIEFDLVAAREGGEHEGRLGFSDRAAVGELLERRNDVARRLGTLLGETSPDEDEADTRVHVREGLDALTTWLDAPFQTTDKRIEKVVRVLMLAAVIAAGWGAYVYHWAVLALLVPVVAPLSALLNRGDDATWVRRGAERRFRGCGLAEPAEWEKDAVAARIVTLGKELELQELRIARPSANPEVDEQQVDTHFGELSMEQVEVNETLKAALARFDLVEAALDRALLASFASAAAASRVHNELQRVIQERVRLIQEAASHRDATWRVLNRWGATGGDASASAQSLEAGLDRLASVSDDACPM